MYVLKLALQKLASRPGSTAFSVLLFAIGCSIISLIILAEKNLNSSVQRNFSEIDLVIGAKGSPLQLILSSVLHADYPTGNISLREAENIARNPLVKKAIPLALGDNYRGFRIIGAPVEYAELYNATIENGTWYENTLEAVVGAHVARTTGLQIGDTFYGVHGFQDAGHSHPEFLYTVKGILEKGSGVIDNLILTPISSVWKVHDGTHHSDHGDPHHEHGDHNHESDDPHDHDHDHENCEHDHHDHENCDHEHHDHGHNHEPFPEHGHEHAQAAAQQHEQPVDPAIAAIQEMIEAGEDISLEEMQLYTEFMQQSQVNEETDDREITAMLLQFRSPAGMIQLTRMINESTRMQAAAPALEINRLMSLLSVGFDLLLILAWVIIAFSGINIFIHLWNMLRGEMQDIALMRVMGASQTRVFLLLVAQGVVIALAGWMGGIVLSRIIWLLLPSFHFMTETGYAVLYTQELMLLIYTLGAGFLASLIPAWNAYNADVHFNLTKK